MAPILSRLDVDIEEGGGDEVEVGEAVIEKHDKVGDKDEDKVGVVIGEVEGKIFCQNS